MESIQVISFCMHLYQLMTIAMNIYKRKSFSEEYTRTCSAHSSHQSFSLKSLFSRKLSLIQMHSFEYNAITMRNNEKTFLVSARLNIRPPFLPKEIRILTIQCPSQLVSIANTSFLNITIFSQRAKHIFFSITN